MCGIAGFVNFSVNYKEEPERWIKIQEQINREQKHRGPDGAGSCLTRHCGLSHTRLSILDLQTGGQPMTRQEGARHCTIVYNGEIYNMPQLRRELAGEGALFSTTSDTEVILIGYMLHGEDFVTRLNGIFAFAIWDEQLQRLLLFRDRVGVKPLFYTTFQDTFLFSSEIKGILCWPGIQTIVDREGLCEVFGLGPAKTSGKGVFRDIREVLPGHCITISRQGVRCRCYWKLESRPHEDSCEETVERTEYLVTDAIRMQMLSDVPVCTFLSGGIDSSFVTAVCSEELKKQGKQLDTYSFDFRDNDINFTANTFQPTQDRPWVAKMAAFSGTRHHYLECCNEQLFKELYAAVDARDLPCMADVESSMLYFCREVSQNHKVALTGECADEIFGGYPWFHREDCLAADTFPWSMDFSPRTMLLKDEVLHALPLEEYAHAAYEKTIAETPALEGEDPLEARRREISYLNLRWFMQTLLDRMDRTSMHTGLEARVPLADHRIIEYLWNVPWHIKCLGGMEKGLLRAAAERHLPREILHRKKSPYPKTYDPAYEHLLKQKILEIVSDSHSPISELIDRKKVAAYLRHPSDYGRPFYGQLMAGPQLLAYLLQVNYWLEHYRITLKL